MASAEDRVSVDRYIGSPSLQTRTIEMASSGEMLRMLPQPNDHLGGLDGHIESTVRRMTSLPQESSMARCCKIVYSRTFREVVFKLCLYTCFFVYMGFVSFKHPRKGIVMYFVLPVVVYKFVNLVTKGWIQRKTSLVWRKTRKCCRHSRRQKRWIKRTITITCLVAIAGFLIYDLWTDWHRYISLAGIAIFIIGSVCFSSHRTKIRWLPVLWGLILQFCLGLLILRWEPGFSGCLWFGQQVTQFLGYADTGSKFVFGDKYLDHPIVFKVLPTVVFFSATVSVLYHLGVMQTIIRALAIVIQFTMETTPIESFAAAAQIFLGQTDISVALRPFLTQLTYSELNAIMTGGFATVSGSIIAAYVEFGVPVEHVITASFMSAPAALAIAKISVPETDHVVIRRQEDVRQPASTQSNLVEALSAGATSAIALVSSVAVNLIVFIASMAFLDTVLAYLCSIVDLPDINFQVICSYIFMPVALVMGVPWAESMSVGALIGKKIVVNEFLAFIDMTSKHKAGLISLRSEVLTTYMLCGFGSIAALGINLGCMSSAAPSRISEIASLCVRAMINGNIACFMTACVAGLLYQDPTNSTYNHDDLVNNSTTNVSLHTYFNITQLQT